MPFPILFGTTVTTVLHYRADCEKAATVVETLSSLRVNRSWYKEVK